MQKDVPVKQTERKIRAIPVCGKWHFGHSGEVIQPVEMWGVGCGVVSPNEKVDRVWPARAQGVREGTANPRRGRGRTKSIGVADLVETDVAFDVLRELHSVA